MTTQITPHDIYSKDGDKKRRNLARPILLILVVLFIAGGTYVFYTKPDPNAVQKKKQRAVPVSVATARIQDVPIEIRTIGNVLAYSVVNVVPQVGGQLKKVYFNQGQFVKKGDLLFEIDPRQFKASLDQALGNVAKDRAQIQTAQANLARDEAQVGLLQANLQKDVASAKYARLEMGRYSELVTQGAVSPEQSDQMSTNASTADATIDADKKAIENAKQVLAADRAAILTAKGTLEADQAAMASAQLLLSWTQIRSPLDGKTGSLNVYEGNVVAANSAQPLVTIEQVQPIYVNFTLPEQNLDQIRRSMTDKTLKVNALVEGEKRDSVEGTVSFLENTVNTSAGTVMLRAAFPNTHMKLFPGQFTDVIVTMPPDGKTVVVPATALQTSQQGNSVYVLKPDNTVDFVTVDLKRTFGNMAAIGKGLNAGDVVVTDGQLQLTPGAQVSVQPNRGQASGS